jgi:hypothetical protein
MDAPLLYRLKLETRARHADYRSLLESARIWLKFDSRQG